MRVFLLPFEVLRKIANVDCTWLVIWEVPGAESTVNAKKLLELSDIDASKSPLGKKQSLSNP